MKIAGLDTGFSARRRSADIGVYDGKQIKLIDCFGVEARKSLVEFGRYNIIAIDGPVVPKGYGTNEARAVERLFVEDNFRNAANLECPTSPLPEFVFARKQVTPLIFWLMPLLTPMMPLCFLRCAKDR